jgi:biopolymer transport protein ExbB
LAAGALAFAMLTGDPARSQAPAAPAAEPGAIAADPAPALPEPPPPLPPSTAEALAAPAPAGAAASEPGPATGLDLALPRDLTPWGMFQAADRVVKAVMIGLAFASLATWTICLAKSLEIVAAGARLRRALRAVLAADSLGAAEAALAGRRGPAASMVRAANLEAASAPAALRLGDGRGFLQRVDSQLERIEARAARRLNLGIGVLATIGATAPFVGLFGTVWGIMNSFIGISEAQTTNLAVVAPGIAEALLATALGLVAAIPAVVIYNLFARWIAGYRARLADASAAVGRLASRDLDHRRLVPTAVARAAE